MAVIECVAGDKELVVNDAAPLTKVSVASVAAPLFSVTAPVGLYALQGLLRNRNPVVYGEFELAAHWMA